MHKLLCFSCLGARFRRSPRPPISEASSSPQVHVLPTPDPTFQPYLPMSIDNTYDIFLHADGDNERVPVNAYLDKHLKNSIISEEKAQQTGAILIKLAEPFQVEDDQGRQYNGHFSIIVSWYLRSKPTVTHSEEFYVFAPCNVSRDVRLRADIEPYLHPAKGLFVLRQKKDRTKEDKQKQEDFKKAQEKKREEAAKARKEDLKKKYGGGGGGGTNGTGGASGAEVKKPCGTNGTDGSSGAEVKKP